MSIFLDLFLTFLKIGAVSFGGGYAMIPLLTDEVVLHGWMTESEVMNFIAVSESTPGPVAINMATFIGASQGGFLGALLSTLGVVLPSFIIILVVVALIKKLLQFAGVKAFLSGVRPVVIGLIVSTGIIMFSTVIIGIKRIEDTFSFNWKALIIFAVICMASFIFKKYKKKNISAVFLILLSAGLGIIFYGFLGYL